MDTNLDIIKYLNTKTCEEIIKLLDSENLIGKGFWGTIYKFDIKGYKVSVKIQPLENDKKYDISIKDPRNIKLEVNLLKQLSHYKILNNFVHFPFFYLTMECLGQNLMFYEYYLQNLKQFFFTPYNFNDFKNISYQILISIYFFQNVTGHYHNDIHVENFLINKLKEPNEKVYVFEGIKKTFILEKYVITIWDFANAIKIENDNKINLDLLQFKSMFLKFSKKIIDEQLICDDLYLFCLKCNKHVFESYYNKQFKDNKIKWKNIPNANTRSCKIEKSLKKAIIYWIIENKYLDQLVKYFNLEKIKPPIYLPTNEMLEWIDSIPTNFNDIWNRF